MENTEEVDHQEHGRENEKVEGKTSVSNWRLRKPLSPDEKDLRNDAEEYELESTRAKIGEAREENERLKTVLSRIVKDYQSLQMHFFDIVQQEQSKKPVENSPKPIDHHHEGPHELVSLGLGASAKAIIKKKEKGSKLGFDDGLRSDGLTLGLERKNIETSSFEDVKDVDLRVENDEIAPQSNPAKRARVSVRARCDGPTMNDGCQWRKYGQKVSKGNPCPRAYYRCSVAPGCPVRKQVQRCIGDMSILITTYEGTHNHPLPISAAAMASTTSAAAHMLTSGPTAPRPATGSTSLASAFYISNPYRSTSHPTITLDLTSNSNSNSTSTISQYLQYPPGQSQQSHWQKASTSGLSYSYPLSMDMITRAITSDPSFQSALVAAITSYVGAWGDGQLGSTSAFRGGSGGSTPVVLGPVAGLSGTESSGPTVDERKESD